MPRITGFNHFSAAVSDMDGALGFWRDLLGLELLGRGVVEYDHLDQIVGLAGRASSGRSSPCRAAASSSSSGTSALRAARWRAG